MNKKYIKIGAITLVSLGAIYGGYKLFKYLTKSTEEGVLPVDIVDTSGGSENQTSSKPTFDANKIVKFKSRGDEAKTVQTALNNIISDAKRLSSSDVSKEIRRKDVAKLTPLKIDGIIGDKSIAVLIKIMGKSSTSYNEVKNKRIAFSKAYGGANPYSI
jgi:hypothetical protein